jgi:hypothetical protein
MEKVTCRLCGGNAGLLSPDGAHYLCEALAEDGIATPCLGYRCTACDGRGYKSNTRAVLINPSQREINVVWPTCDVCHGTGTKS